ncbi:acyltransferase [Dysgonomonas sp. 25]|uniref:acyltransferase family protein n=1 Tax=Dysgonomonas sp. 25 TaxID=2302933 RepID=UPI0013D5B476|nr:acyltransferase [Dysgonomonas sp. 25]NDV69273.1 acyltransferase [Dysgonomonas sp. 25]
MKKIEKLDAIRGLVALYVVLHHIFLGAHYPLFGINIAALFEYGAAAVMVFFVLSGFVIQLSFENSKDKSFRTFFVKRFFRIYIPLICVFIANYLLILIQGKPIEDSLLHNLVGNLLMLQNVSLYSPEHIEFGTFLGNAPLWSLTFEWWFYMIYFVLVKYCNRYATRIVYIAAIISVFISIVYPIFYNKLLIFLVIWWSGVELAKLYAQNKRITFISMYRPLLVLTTIVVILFLSLQFNIVNEQYKSYVNVTYFYMKFSLIVLLGGIVWHLLKWRLFNQTIGVFKYFANISYGIYISHWFLIVTADYLSFIQNSFIRYPMYLLICLGFSYLIERVIYVRLNKYFMKRVFHK